MRLLARSTLAALAAACALSAARAAAPDHVWIEAEAPTATPPTANAGPWNKADLLSGGRALSIFAEKKDLGKIPDEGVTLAYDFDAPSAGTYEAWNRVGMENIRSGFEWRINGGAWQINTQTTHRTIDIVETAFWNPLGWTRLGDVQLNSGKNRLEIRVSKTRDAKNEPLPVRYVSDAIVFTKGAFIPNHKHPPGDSWKSDADRAAATHTFPFTPTPATPASREAAYTAAPASTPARDVIPLAGTWQYAPWDELGDISEESRPRGVDALPSDLAIFPWRAMKIPGERNSQLPNHYFNHRYLLRARVDIPASARGRSFRLDLREVSLIASLFVNGKKIGDSDVVLGFWTPDITSAVQPGKTNEIVLVIKDTFYAMRPTKDGSNLRSSYYIPRSLFEQNQGTTNRFDFPVKGADDTGVMEAVNLLVSGPAYVEDAFIKTSVANKELSADLTVRSAPGASVAQAEVTARVTPWPAGDTVLTLPKATVALGSGPQTVTVKSPWPDAKLWWPDSPQLYQLVTEVRVRNQLVDTQVTRFGFREWQVRGNQFYLNGIRWQLRADTTPPERDQNTDAGRREYVKMLDERGINMFRLRFQYNWAGLRYGQTLAFMDDAGMPVRLHTGSFDGQHASYDLGTKNAPNTRLYANWHKQLLNRARAWRNHPSVFIWELDNEIIYINGRNLGRLDAVEPEFTKAYQLLKELDPTRSVVIGGGNALRDQSLPTYGNHYFEINDREYPAEAYTIEKSLARQNRKDNLNPWPVDFDAKPFFMSETAFLPGRNPAGFAAVGGEVTFLGKVQSRPAIAKIARWLAEGYRWKGVSGFHFWMDGDFSGNGHYLSFQPVAVFCREWNWTFGSGQQVARTLKVFNETRFSDPIEAEWEFAVAGKRVAGEKRTFNIPAGANADFPAAFTVPAAPAARADATFTLVARRGGKELFREVKSAVVIDPEAGPKPKLAAPGDILVWDAPNGVVSQRLKARGVAFKPVANLAAVPEKFGLLIVGPDVVSLEDSSSPRWLALAAAGNRILVLDQKYPLENQAVPADLSVTDRTGRIAFPQEESHPAFAGLAERDFAVWSGDEIVYRNVYKKASRGARSLAHCDDEVGFSTLVTCSANDGVLVLSQFALGGKLATEPVAKRLFDNLVAYAAGYQLVKKPVAVVADAATPAGRMLGNIGLAAERATDPVAAIKSGKAQVIVVQAIGDHLAKLAAAPEAVKAFTENGGYLMILGVTPENLADFNKLVGYDHILRPFRMERVQFPVRRDPLTAGLGLSDVVMSSGQRIQVFNRDEWPSDDAFRYIVDLDDVAPFAAFPPASHFGATGEDRQPLNMVNGYGGDTHWKLTFMMNTKPGSVLKWDLDLPREEEITGFSLQPNRTYHDISKLRLTFDGDPASAQEVNVTATKGSENFTLKPRKAKKLTIEVLDWSRDGTQDVLGIDTLAVTVRRPVDFDQRVRPLLNIGGLVHYPRGKGGIVLNQYNFIDAEKNPANAQKKQVATATLLRNLGAAFTGGQTVVAGKSLVYSPVSLEGVCNLYLKTAQGFPVKDTDLSAVPVGRNTFASVEYDIRDFATSPLESGVMLRHPRYKIVNEKPEIRGIPVNAKADAIFFLQTLLPGDTWKPKNDADDAPVVFNYVATYADGTKETIPVVLGEGIAPWLQPAPRSIKNAALAWQAEAAKGQKLAIYQFQWSNPHPEKPIATLGIVYGPQKEKWGAPVILAITTATARK